MGYHSFSSAFVLMVMTACAVEHPAAQPSTPLQEVARVVLPNVGGRIDHLAYDPTTRRLFVAALGNNTVEVIDAASAVHLQSLTGFHEPQGIAIAPEVGGVAVANGGTGTLQMIDAQTLQIRWTRPVAGDADNVRYDAAARLLYVAAEGGLFVFNPATGDQVGHIAFSGHPESFQLEGAGRRVFANLPGASEIVVSSRETRSVTSRIAMTSCAANYPMALDESTSRLFVGCRRPARLVMFDTAGGSLLSAAEIVADTDDLFYDAAAQSLYVIGGEGFVDILARNGDRLERVSRLPTRAGARTGLFVPELRHLYVAVPAQDGQAAEIRVLEATRR